MSKQWQVELWQECGHGQRCSFCYLKDDNLYTPDELKLDTLNKTIAALDTLRKTREYDTVSYIGGEFFQGQLDNPAVHDKFMELMQKTAKLYKDGIIKSVWLAATMTVGEQKHLWEALDYFKDMEQDGNHGMWVITSWDIKGRFNRPGSLQCWEDCVAKIHQKYPKYRLNTTIILTGALIDAYLSGSFRFRRFCSKYGTSVFMKQPSPAINGNEQGTDFMKAKAEFQKKVPFMFVTRDVFLKFLALMYQEEPELYEKLFNIQFRADTLMRNYNDSDRHMVLNTRLKNNKLEFDPNTIPVSPNKCGHPMDYTPYLDCNECCLCDKHMIQETFE